MGLNFAQIYANGVMIAEFEPADTTDIIRVDETFEFEFMEDAHIEALVGSTNPSHQMAPVAKKQPFSNTNPIFIDADGDGYLPIYLDGAPWDAQ